MTFLSFYGNEIYICSNYFQYSDSENYIKDLDQM